MVGHGDGCDYEARDLVKWSPGMDEHPRTNLETDRGCVVYQLKVQLCSLASPCRSPSVPRVWASGRRAGGVCGAAWPGHPCSREGRGQEESGPHAQSCVSYHDLTSDKSFNSFLEVEVLVAEWCLTLLQLCGLVALQAPLSMGFSRQEYWCGLPFPSPGDLPNPGIEPGFPALLADSLPFEPRGLSSATSYRNCMMTVA